MGIKRRSKLSIRNLGADQRGMASFMVTTVLILVLGLIIVGFSQTVRRNQRETLDRQLSTQAFYAAETGINAARAVVNQALQSGGVQSKETCGPNLEYEEVRLADNVEVSCLLVETELEALVYSDVTEGESTLVPVLSADGTSPINSITLTWNTTEADNTTPVSGCTTNGSSPLPARGSWSCGYGILRADVAGFPLGGINPADTVFFVPRSTSAIPPAFSISSGGGLVQASCNNTRCEARISGLPSGPAHYLRLRSLYKDAAVTVTASYRGDTVALGGQVQIDATGKAQDVLRRIQVRMPVIGNADIPSFAIESTSSICKRFIAAPNYYSNDNALCDGFQVN